MKLWTLQPLAVADGLLRGEPAFAAPDFERDWGEPPGAAWGFSKAYAWMASRMAVRLGPAPAGVQFPMWAWARPPQPTRGGAPDMRTMRSRARPGEPFLGQALVELDVPDSDALLSEHGSWHFALNGWPLGLCEAEQDALDARVEELASLAGRPLGPHGLLAAADFADPAILAVLASSWERIFQIAPLVDGLAARMDFLDPADPSWVNLDTAHVQACLWSLSPAWVSSIRRFEPPRPPAAPGIGKPRRPK